MKDTRTMLTWELVEEGHVKPSKCNHCWEDNPGFTTRVDDQQLRGKGDWSWQCQSCGQLVSLPRAAIVKRWQKAVATL